MLEQIAQLPGEGPLTATDGAGQEIEAKFVLRDEFIARQLHTADMLIPGYELGSIVEIEDADTYYDTVDFGLLRRGYTLRLRDRTEGSGATQRAACKDIDLSESRGVHVRIEVEQPVEPPLVAGAILHLESLPTAVADALGNIVDADADLVPLCRLHQSRAKRDVFHMEDGVQVALGELSIDDVLVQRPLPQLRAKSSKRTTDRHEIVEWRPAGKRVLAELEIGDAVRFDELRWVVDTMRRLPGVTPSHEGKLQMALAVIAQAGAGDYVEDWRYAHTAEFCRSILHRQLIAMLVNEPGVRMSDDIEFVHEMRVATRRARVSWQLYRGYFASKSRALDRIRAGLRKTGRLLGEVRDLDVALERLACFADEQEESPEVLRGKKNKKGKKVRQSNRKDSLVTRMKAARERAYWRLVEWLDSEQYANFIVEYARFCASPRKDAREFPISETDVPVYLARHTLPTMTWIRFEAVRAFEAPLLAPAAGSIELPIETLHALRIECKYLRYQLEFAASMLGAAGIEYIALLKTLQDELGALNDAAVGIVLARTYADRLADKSAKGHSSGESLAETWVQQQNAIIEEKRNTIPQAFAELLNEENRLTLARAIAHI